MLVNAGHPQSRFSGIAAKSVHICMLHLWCDGAISYRMWTEKFSAEARSDSDPQLQQPGDSGQLCSYSAWCSTVPQPGQAGTFPKQRFLAPPQPLDFNFF